MSLLDSLLGGQNSGSLMQLAERFGLDGGQMQSVVSQLAPALSSGIVNNTQQNGLASLLQNFQSGDHAQYAQDPQLLQQPQATDAGNGLLGQIFGGKDISRQVADSTAQQTGVSSGIIKKLLPLVAIMAVSALHKKSQQLPQGAAAPEGLMGQLSHFLGNNGQQPSIAEEVMGMLSRRSA